MPFVLVRTEPNLIEADKLRQKLRQFIKILPAIVADALNVPGTEGELTAKDIEVKVEKFGPLDVYNKDLDIIIWANDYPERRKNIDERRSRIIEQVKALSPATDGSVWILLQPGSFGEF